MSLEAKKKPVFQRGSISIYETLGQYGDTPLCDFVNEAVKYGLIPMDFQLYPADELVLCPQRFALANLSTQNGLAS